MVFDGKLHNRRAGAGAHLTDKGLAELGVLFPDIDAVFVPTENATLSDDALKQAFPRARCVLLGREISCGQYQDLLAEVDTKTCLDLASICESA